LTAHEESELVRWVTHLTKTGYPVQHSELLSMAKEIQQQRVRKINEEYELISYPPIGKDWTKRFLSRHPELQTVQGKAIDANRVQGATHEAINKWFDAYKETIQQYQISPEKEANMDESGFSIGKINATRVIINKTIRQKLQAQPGRQEWVSAVECICGDGTAIPPLIIFKGENLNSQWIPSNVPLDWKFSCNSKGWTSDMHGIEWLK
jgi:DDE superfamily endonuclease/Tc5 transposase DNA-binding domain